MYGLFKMIEPLPVRIIGDIGIFSKYPNITADSEADIVLMDKDVAPQDSKKYYIAKFFKTNSADEVWVKTLEQKIEFKQAGVIKPIIIMTADEKLLTVTMRDRIIYLQDKINKQHEHNK